MIPLSLRGHVFNLHAHDTLARIPRCSAGAVIVDPPASHVFPLGAGIEGGRIDELAEHLEPVLRHTWRVLMLGRPLIVLGDHSTLTAWDLAATRAGLRRVGDLYILWTTSPPSDNGNGKVLHWFKKKASMSKRRAHQQKRPYAQPGSLATCVQWFAQPGLRCGFTERQTYSSNVYSCSRVPREIWEHPAQKPVELMKMILTTLTEKGSTIVDMYCGTGSTLVAAEMCGRSWVGGDIDGRMCEIARRRTGAEGDDVEEIAPIYRWSENRLEKIE